MAEDLIIFPFGGNAKEALLSVLAVNKIKKKWNVLGFVDDDPSTWGNVSCGVKVLGGSEVIKRYPDAKVLTVQGRPDNYLKREDVARNLVINPARFATIIDPSATVSPDAKIGRDIIVMPNVFISSNVTIGDHCVILPNTVISHHSAIGGWCLVGSNVSVSSSVTIGPKCYIGSGASIRDHISIKEGTLIGLGSNVVSNIEEYSVAAGNPARVIRKADR